MHATAIYTRADRKNRDDGTSVAGNGLFLRLFDSKRGFPRRVTPDGPGDSKPDLHQRLLPHDPCDFIAVLPAIEQSNISIRVHRYDFVSPSFRSVCYRFVLEAINRAGITQEVDNILSQIATNSLKFQVYLNVTQAKRMISLLLLSNFCPAMSYRRARKIIRGDELLCTLVRSLVTVRETSRQRKGLTLVTLTYFSSEMLYHFTEY